MTCKELVELVTAYLENALPEHERARFEAHLKGCKGCTNYVEQVRETIRLVGKVSEDSMKPRPAKALLQAFRDWHKPSNTPDK